MTIHHCSQPENWCQFSHHDIYRIAEYATEFATFLYPPTLCDHVIVSGLFKLRGPCVLAGFVVFFPQTLIVFQSIFKQDNIRVFLKHTRLATLSLLITLYSHIFSARKQSLGQGNIFRSVCQEFCSLGESTWAATPPPPRTRYTPGQQGGSTHPTGMHSC